MQELELNKGEQLFAGSGWGLFATDDKDLAIMQWEDKCAGRLAWDIHHMLKGHALSTNCVQRFGASGIVVKQLEMLAVTLRVQTTPTDTQITLLGEQGTELERKEAEQLPHVKPTRLATMEDVALHTARCLRAHLAPMGFAELDLRLQFGLAAGGETLLSVPNPLECSFGTEEYEALCERLGHKDGV